MSTQSVSERLKVRLEKGDLIDLPPVKGRHPGQVDSPYKTETPARPGCRVLEVNEKRVILENPLGGKKIRLLWKSFNSNKWAGSFKVHKTI